MSAPTSDAAKFVAALIQVKVIEEVTKVEGRMPPDDEMRRRGKFVLEPNGTFRFRWDDKELFNINMRGR